MCFSSKLFFFALLVLVQPFVPGKIIASAPVGTEYCRPLDETPKLLRFAEMVDPTLSLPRDYQLCTNSVFGLFEHDLLRVEIITAEDETKRYSLRIGVFVDNELNMITPFDFESIFMILTPLVYALYVFKFRATPGKNIVGIRLYNFGQKPSLLRLIGREYLRFAPFVFFFSSLIFLFCGDCCEQWWRRNSLTHSKHDGTCLLVCLDRHIHRWTTILSHTLYSLARTHAL